MFDQVYAAYVNRLNVRFDVLRHKSPSDLDRLEPTQLEDLVFFEGMKEEVEALLRLSASKSPTTNTGEGFHSDVLHVVDHIREYQ